MTNRRSGFTLIEVMMATVVFAGSMVAFAAFYSSIGRMSESSRDLTQAMNDAHVVLEAMRDTAQTNGLTGANGVTGRYPEGPNLAVTLGLITVSGLRTLPNETITVDYVNAAADPLQVVLQVNWDQRGYGRSRAITTETLITRRQ
ncbi:MAG: prepilin-type N-terminal cleavage/methylation domain-containing protein [Candidatus Omnitrophota bacterium]|nr:prepilin-type N-terminal cleavage/methylation domain-containing protein [Candidatus Omnitrophota bacterium]